MELEKQGILQPNWMTDNGIKLKPKYINLAMLLLYALIKQRTWV